MAQAESRSPFVEAYDYYNNLKKTNIDEQDRFDSALELFAENMVHDVSNYFFNEGWKEGYAEAHEDIAETLNRLSGKVRRVVNYRCDMCDCEDGNCHYE